MKLSWLGCPSFYRNYYQAIRMTMATSEGSGQGHVMIFKRTQDKACKELQSPWVNKRPKMSHGENTRGRPRSRFPDVFPPASVTILTWKLEFGHIFIIESPYLSLSMVVCSPTSFVYVPWMEILIGGIKLMVLGGQPQEGNVPSLGAQWSCPLAACPGFTWEKAFPSLFAFRFIRAVHLKWLNKFGFARHWAVICTGNLPILHGLDWFLKAAYEELYFWPKFRPPLEEVFWNNLSISSHSRTLNALVRPPSLVRRHSKWSGRSGVVKYNWPVQFLI